MSFKQISFLFTVLVISNGLYAQKYIYSESESGARSFREGTLTLKENIPFLTVKGNSYEMGLQYGVLLNDQLLEINRTIDSLMDSYLGNFFLKFL